MKSGLLARGLLACVLCRVMMPAQTARPGGAESAPEISSRDTAATFKARVNLVTVPVVVRDGEGRAIGNLKQQDFQLFDKGKPQAIAKFSMEKSGGRVIEANTQPGAAEGVAQGENSGRGGPARAVRCVCVR